MTIQDLGAIGDLVGGVAVLVTLVYLAMQIKQNTRVHASLIRQNFYDATQQQILHAVESQEFNELIHRSWSTDAVLTGCEQMRHGGVFNQDFLDEVESLKEEASPYKRQLDERGLPL